MQLLIALDRTWTCNHAYLRPAERSPTDIDNRGLIAELPRGELVWSAYVNDVADASIRAYGVRERLPYPWIDRAGNTDRQVVSTGQEYCGQASFPDEIDNRLHIGIRDCGFHEYNHVPSIA